MSISEKLEGTPGGNPQWCPKCGAALGTGESKAEVAPGAPTCEACGVPLVQPSPETGAPVPPPPPAKNRNPLALVVVAIVAAGMLYFGFHMARRGGADNAAPPILGKSTPAPNFTLDKLDGGNLKLSDLRGKAVLLNFWATWCPPCREEMPTLETLFQTFKDRSDFVLLAVDSEEHKETVSEFLKNNPYRFPVLLDTTGEADLQYSIEAIPTTYLIDAQGEVVAGTKGAFDWTKKEFIDGLKLLLAAKN